MTILQWYHYGGTIAQWCHYQNSTIVGVPQWCSTIVEPQWCHYGAIMVSRYHNGTPSTIVQWYLTTSGAAQSGSENSERTVARRWKRLSEIVCVCVRAGSVCVPGSEFD